MNTQQTVENEQLQELYDQYEQLVCEQLQAEQDLRELQKKQES